MMVQHIKTDICVIGGGSGGLSVAAGAAQMGTKVVLVEGHKMGGDCLNYGCVPSKALLAAANRAVAHHKNTDFGLTAAAPKVDFAAVMAHVGDVIKSIEPMDSVERFEGLGVKVVEAKGRFIDAKTLKAGSTTITAKRFVIATGSMAAIPPIKGLKGVPFLTNETIFGLQKQPKHLLVLGGGPIGAEMAQAFARLGSKVTLLEAARFLGREDEELSAHVKAQLIADGVDMREGETIVNVAHKGKSGATKITLTCAAGATTHEITGDALLVAAGRAANIAGLDVEKAGVTLSDNAHPHIVVDKRLRTSNKKIFAIGDVAGGPQFTHAAGYHAGLVIRNILFFLPAKVDHGGLPRVTYTNPELASVGLSEAEAREKYAAIKVLRWPFEENDRARAERDQRGLVKIITTRQGKILGASIVGAGAGDLLAPWTMALAQGLPISAMAGVIAPYPTRGEASKRAAGDYYTPTLFGPRTRKIVGFLSLFRR
jgi:pyruvate/2-oxoglutarate dehydrogenase complex dihydrolipoamide dehydrogenase (E3) component